MKPKPVEIKITLVGGKEMAVQMKKITKEIKKLVAQTDKMYLTASQEKPKFVEIETIKNELVKSE